MNRFSRDMLMRRSRDGRNPYGSRGGYVTSRDPRRRDRARSEHEYEDYRGYGRDRERYGEDRHYEEPDYARNRREYERSGRDYGYGYGVGMFDYDTEDYNYDYRGYGRDYDDEEKMRLTNKDIKKWEKHMENADGTTGKHYELDQIRQVAQQLGIRFEEYSPELLCAITNMMYSDYCKVLGNDLMMYVKLARAFLDDDDFDGTPEEKAYLYYKCIVDKED